jgi:hypothetical protein
MGTIIPSSPTMIAQLMARRLELLAWLDSHQDADGATRDEVIDLLHGIEGLIAYEPASSVLARIIHEGGRRIRRAVGVAQIPEGT